MKKVIIELELKDGAAVMQMRPDMVAAGFKHREELVAEKWIGQYLDGGGEQNWFRNFEDIMGEVPDAAYTKNIRLVEVGEDNSRWIIWTWKTEGEDKMDALTKERDQLKAEVARLQSVLDRL